MSSKATGKDGVLLTGGTGFIGGQLLIRYLERTDRRLYVLVRARNQRQASARLQRALVTLLGKRDPYPGRVVALRGDVAAADLGLGRRRDQLCERIGEVVHAAATVSFADGLDACRGTNVCGTRNVVEFAARCQRRGGLRRLTHISTAYVAGDHGGAVSEDDLDLGQRFRNGYERSKFEAERLVAGWRQELPITVVRPSIVVGERDTGWTSSFNVLYQPLRLFSRGAYAAVPARRSAPVDVVPVDYVADATFALSQAREGAGATFNLTAGEHCSSVAEVVELASGFFDRRPPLLVEPPLFRTVVEPLIMRASPNARLRRALARSRLFFPYFDMQATFDERRARAVLHGTGIAPSPLSDYFARLVEFALGAEWGARTMPRTAEVVTLASARRTRRRRQTRVALRLAG